VAVEESTTTCKYRYRSNKPSLLYRNIFFHVGILHITGVLASRRTFHGNCRRSANDSFTDFMNIHEFAKLA